MEMIRGIHRRLRRAALLSGREADRAIENVRLFRGVRNGCPEGPTAHL